MIEPVAAKKPPPRATGLGGRPTATLPRTQLVRLSLYWLGLSSIFAGLTNILGNRLQFTGLVAPGSEGTALFGLTIGGSLVALLVQPTIGSLSDYTISRWGRRKPYILVGSILDVVFLYGIAVSNGLLAIAAFVILLQFSSNFAQGPFQGYVPDLVPAHQVGIASSLVGLMQIMGNVAGFAIGSIAAATHNYVAGTMALGVLELATMLSVVLRVNDGHATKSRNGRSWFSIAREAWATDVLRERSFLWLVGSRLLFLMGAAMLVILGPFYLHQTFGLDEVASGTTFLIVVGFVLIANLVAVIPAGRLSDRIGRKRLLYGSFGLGAAGMATVTVAPSLPVAYLGVVLFGLASGSFLAVDWALMTEIIPRASSGRYMGISNVATASASIFALALGGTLMDAVGRSAGPGVGPRAAYGLAVVFFIIGGLLLRPVNEPHRRHSAHVRHVVVVGLMGAGKTTLGTAVAAQLGWPLHDSDADLLVETGLTARQILDREGTAALHEAEAAMLFRALAQSGPNVICPAASVVDDAAARTALAGHAVVVIWLRASPAVLARRFTSGPHRPVYGPDPEEVARARAASRNPRFEALDPITIDVDDLAPDAVVAAALVALRVRLGG